MRDPYCSEECFNDHAIATTRGTRCPLDGSAMDGQVNPCPVAFRGLPEALPWTCPACHTVSDDGAMLSHRDGDACPAALSSCPDGCGVRLPRRDVARHGEVCERRLVGCPHLGCDFRCPAAHRDQLCPRRPALCPNACLARGLVNSDIPSHRTECPVEDVFCHCGQGLSRGALQDHVNESVDRHVSLITEQNRTLRTVASNQTLHDGDLQHNQGAKAGYFAERVWRVSERATTFR
jgi:hypothetical protein